MRGLRRELNLLEDSDFGIVNKKEISNMAKNIYNGNIEYKMSADMAKAFLKERRGAELKMKPEEYLCKIVNEEFGLRSHCSKVILN